MHQARKCKSSTKKLLILDHKDANYRLKKNLSHPVFNLKNVNQQSKNASYRLKIDYNFMHFSNKCHGKGLVSFSSAELMNIFNYFFIILLIFANNFLLFSFAM